MCPDSRVVGGGVVGLLVAANPIQVCGCSHVFLRSECLHNISSVLYVCALLFIWHGRFEILCFSGSYILGADGGIWTQNRRLCKYFLSVLLRISERRLLY